MKNNNLAPLNNYLSMLVIVCLTLVAPLSNAAEGTGLLGSYFPTTDFSGAQQNRLDQTVGFDWKKSGPGVSGIPSEGFSVAWNGFIVAPSTEVFTFFVLSDEGVFLLIDDKLQIKNWANNKIMESSTSLSLEKGRKYKITLRYVHNAGNSVVKLQWGSSSVSKQIIPIAYLYPPATQVDELQILSPADSRTNPAWLEGSSSATSSKIDAQIAGVAAGVTRLSPNRWYASSSSSGQPLGILLNASKVTAVTLKSYEGTQSKTLTATVRWTVTDLANLPYGLESITVRTGDSLLLAVQKQGVKKVEIDTNYNGSTFISRLSGGYNTKFQVPFSIPGVYNVRARCDGIDAGRIAVTVVGVDFLGSTADEVGYQRLKDISILPTVNAAQKLCYTANDPNLLLVDFKKVTTTGVQLSLLPFTKGDRTYQIRIGDSNGPIVAQQPISTFIINTSATKTIPIIEEFSDGTWKAEAFLTMNPLIADLDVHLRTFVSGITFDNSMTKMAVSTNFFTQTGLNGTFVYRLLRAPVAHANFCHAYKVYQNSVQISR